MPGVLTVRVTGRRINNFHLCGRGFVCGENTQCVEQNIHLRLDWIASDCLLFYFWTISKLSDGENNESYLDVRKTGKLRTTAIARLQMNCKLQSALTNTAWFEYCVLCESSMNQRWCVAHIVTTFEIENCWEFVQTIKKSSRTLIDAWKETLLFHASR